MKKLLLLSFLFLGFVVSTWAQQNPYIYKKALFSNPNGVEAAKKNLKIAERYYEMGKGTYDEALKYYLKVYQYNDSCNELNYKIGVCYLWTSNKKASLNYFLKSKPEVALDYYLGLGRGYQYNLEFDKAIQAYTDFLNASTKWEKIGYKNLVTQLIDECNTSAALIKDSVPAFIINLGPIVNSYYDDYGAVISPMDEKLFFTSKRPEKEPEKKVSRYKFKERILVANNNALTSPAEFVEGIQDLNYGVNTSVAGFDNEQLKIYFYKGELYNGGIYSAIFTGKGWRKVHTVKGKINHLAYKETSISMDNSGYAYFITDKRGSLGGKDIWMSSPSGKNKWGKPINLGANINTSFDEEGVYITPDGNTLYFSSKGHPGLGGFDVYKSTKNSDGTWTVPVNMGHPINSASDELFYKPTKDSMVAIYSTLRGDSYGGLDIYKIQLDPRIPFKLIGTVVDAENGSSIPATVAVYNRTTEQLVKSTQVDEDAGIYMFNFDDIGNYFIQVDYDGYKSISQPLNCQTEKYGTIVEDFKLEMLKHPFTLIGRVLDIENGKPLKAQLTFKLAAQPDSVLGRAVSNDSTGKYTFTFDDKYDMIVQATATDYFEIDEPVNVVNVPESVISKDIELKGSKVIYTLTGVVTDEESGAAVHTALSFYYPGETEPFSIVIADSITGKYTAVMDNPGPYLIELEASRYFFANQTYQFSEGQTFTAVNFKLKRMKVGMTFVMNNILFNSGKATLKSESYAELDKLAALLLKNTTVRVEISGHTDNVGSAMINKKISKERALAVKNYLISRGVEQDRVEFEGYGFDKPLASNSTEEGRSQNRRVEVKILD